MDEQLILKMARPYVKDGRLTYEQFDVIYGMLSLREQYKVVEILILHDIELYDAAGNDVTGAASDAGQGQYLSDAEIRDIGKTIGELFTGRQTSPDAQYLTINNSVRQSNEILCHLIQQGNRQAAQDLCIKNRRLVLKCVNAYYRYFGNDLDKDDLEQVGYLGLLEAARHFDASRGNAFSTYAVFWVKQYISRQIIDTGFTIRLPVHLIESISKVTRLEAEYDSKNVGYAERIPLIAEDLHWPEEKVRSCIELRARYRDTVSLNTLVGEDGDTELFELLPDTNQPTLEEVVLSQEQRKKIEEALNHLKERESEVIRLRFGLSDNVPLTLEQIGDRYALTRERIRQIEMKAIRKLQRNRTMKSLRE